MISDRILGSLDNVKSLGFGWWTTSSDFHLYLVDTFIDSLSSKFPQSLEYASATESNIFKATTFYDAKCMCRSKQTYYTRRRFDCAASFDSFLSSCFPKTASWYTGPAPKYLTEYFNYTSAPLGESARRSLRIGQSSRMLRVLRKIPRSLPQYRP